jgi:hypothetical protein
LNQNVTSDESRNDPKDDPISRYDWRQEGRIILTFDSKLATATVYVLRTTVYLPRTTVYLPGTTVYSPKTTVYSGQ